MRSLYRLALASVILLCMPYTTAHAQCDNCCGTMDGVQYCDSSTGRIVCNNGDYSTCYCTRHAVMNLQELKGCCLWKGGVLKTDSIGHVHCNDGSLSDVCSLTPVQPIIAY